MRRKRFLSAVFPIFLGVSAATAAAQTPFAGAWKMDQEKSQLAGKTIKFGPAQDDAIEMLGGGVAYSFRTDGKNYATPTGGIAIWRQTGPDSWSAEYRNPSGKLQTSESWKLSPDETRMTVVSSGVKAGGDPYTDSSDFVRTDGSGQSLLGSWKCTSVKMSSPSNLVIEDSGLDMLTFKIPESKTSCRATLDGKESRCEGPDVPAGWRITVTHSGPYTLNMVQNLNGKTMYSAVYTVSNDGKTLTEVAGPPGQPPATMIWEKQ